MDGIFTNIYHEIMANVGKYTRRLAKVARDLTRVWFPQDVAFWKGNGTP